MQLEIIVLLITNIIVPIISALITGMLQENKHKKEIEILKTEHDHKEKTLQKDFEHQIELQKNNHMNEMEKLKTEHKHQIEMSAQSIGAGLISTLADKVTTEVINSPATHKMINQKTKQKYRYINRK